MQARLHDRFDQRTAVPSRQLRLLGAVSLCDAAGAAQRLPGRPGTLLLARLALWPQRDHPREELIELLWPGVALEVGRNRLRQLLSSLKQLLGPGDSTLVLADRQGVRLAPGALACDAVEFQELLRAGRHAEAHALFGGELLPGFYDDWVLDERSRLQAMLERSAEVAAQRVLPLPPDLARASLPSYLTRAFGMARALSEVSELLSGHRLVTLLGMGGSGKTRLAVEVATGLRDGKSSPFDRVGFVALAGCSTTSEMADTLLEVVGVRSTETNPIERIAAALAGRRQLLVLDNFEQLPAEAALAVAALLDRAPALHLIVTSRRPLGVDGEQQFRVPALALPAADEGVDAAAASPALALFLDRARAAGAALELVPRNLDTLRVLLHALDGLPLAIELAAPRSRTLSLVELQRQFVAQGLAPKGWLSSRAPRHSSMHASLAWSWRLLSSAQRRALAALSVFDSPFVAALAGAVMGDADGSDVTAMLADLSGQSLLRALPGSVDGLSPVRFALPEAIREFAAEQLDDELRERLRRRLRDWLVEWAQGLGPLPSPRVVEPCLEPVRAVLSRAARPGEGPAAWSLALALRTHWDTDALPLRCIEALEGALPQLQDTGQRADALELLAYQRFETGFAELAMAHAEQAIVVAGEDRVRRARALVRRVWIQVSRTLDASQCESAIEEALALSVACGDLESQARALHQQAILVHASEGGSWRAEPLLARAQALWLQLGDTRKAMARLRNRAQCWLAMGRREQAMASFEACEQAAWADGDWVGVIDSTTSLGSVLALQNRWADAAAAYRRGIDVSAKREHMHGLGYGLWNLPRVLARLRQPRSAARLMAFAENFWVSRLGPLGPADMRFVRRVRGLVRAQTSAAQAELWAIEGRTLELAAAVRLALQVPPE